MAVSVRASGTWSATTTQNIATTIPAGYQAGDLGILVAAWRPYTVTATVNQSWVEIIDESPGTTTNGIGVGSSRVYVAWKILSGSETNPTLTRSGAITPAGSVIIVLQKASTEGWDIAKLSASVEQAMSTTAMSHTRTTTGFINIDSLVFALTGVADDSATFTRATTAISGGPTWAANRVEYPATHLSSTTGNDMAADLIYRVASSGVASGQTITITATLSAAERVASVLFGVRAVPTFKVDAVIKVPGQRRRPFVRTVGTAASGTTSLTMNIPTSNNGDYLLALIEHPYAEAYFDYLGEELQTNGVSWHLLGSRGTYIGNLAQDTEILAFVGVKGSFGGTETTATMTFLQACDHAYGVILAIGDARPVGVDGWWGYEAGFPWVYGFSWNNSIDSAVTTVYSSSGGQEEAFDSLSVATPLTSDALLIYAVSNPVDSSSARFSNWAVNTTPSGYLNDTVTEIFDAGTTTGNGGGLGIGVAYAGNLLWGDPLSYEQDYFYVEGINVTQASGLAAAHAYGISGLTSFTLDAEFFAWPGFQVDAYIIPIPSFKIDAVISQVPPFRLNAVIFGARTGTFTVGATLSQVPPFTLDAVIYRRTVESRTEYAYLKASYSGTLSGTSASGGPWTYTDSSSYIRVGVSESGGFTTKYAAALHFAIPNTVDIYAAAGSDLLRVRAVRLDLTNDQFVLSGMSDLSIYAIADWGGFDFSEATLADDTYWGSYTAFNGPRNQAVKLLASSIADDAYTSFDIPVERVLKAFNYYRRGSMSLLLVPLLGYTGSGGIPSSAYGYIDLDTTSDLKVRLAIDIGVDFTVDAVIVGSAELPKTAVHAFARAGMGFKNYVTSYYDYSSHTVPSSMGLSAAQLAAAGFQANDEVLVLWSFRTGEWGDRNGWDLRYNGTSIMDVPNNNYDNGSGSTTNAYARSYMARMSLGGTLSNFATFAKTTQYYEGHINNSDLLVIRLKDFGVEGLDWFWGRSTTDVVHTTTMSSTDRASVTWTPIRVEDWVYAVHIAVDIAQTANSFEWEVDGADGFGLHRSRPVTTEESYNVFRMGLLEDLAASSKTLTIRSRDVGGTTLNSHFGSSILVFRKDRWPDLKYSWTSSNQTLTSGADTSIASVSVSSTGPTMVALGGTFTADDAKTAWAWTDFERTAPEWEFPGLPTQVQNNSTDRLVLHAHSYTSDFDQSSLTAKARSSAGSRTLSGAYLIVWGLRSPPLQYSIDAYIAAGYNRVYGDFDADAIVFGPRSGSWTVSSLKRQTFSGTISVNAFIQPYFRANAVQLTWGAWSDSLGNTYGQAEFELDAIIGRVWAASFTVDATLVATTFLGVIYTDATFLVPRAGTFAVDAILDLGQETIEGSLALNATLLRGQASSFTAAAVIKRTQASATTANAVLKKTASGTFTASSLLKKTASGTFSLSGCIKTTTSASLDVAATILRQAQGQATVDAVLKGTKAGVFGVSATLRRQSVGSLDAAAVIFRSASGQFLVAATLLVHREQLYVLDAVKVRPTEGSFSLNAVLKRQAVSSTTANAVITVTRTGSTHLDALLRGSRVGTFGVQAVIEREVQGSKSVEAVVRTTAYQTVLADAVLRAGRAGLFTANAVLRRSQTGDETLDAVIRRTTSSTTTANALVLRGQVGTFAANAVIRVQGSGSLAVDAVVLAHPSGQAGVEAVLAALNVGQKTLDAVLRASYQVSLEVDAITLRPQVGDLTQDAVIRATKQGAFAADADLQATLSGQFALQAVLAGTYLLDAIVLGHPSSSFSVAARIMPRFSVDALILRPATGVFTVNAWVEGAGIAAFAVDAVIKAQRSDSALVQAVLGRAVQGDATLDAVVLRPEAGQSVLDAVLLRPQTPVGHRVDAVVLALGSDAFDVDGTVLAKQLGSLSSDAVILAHSAASLTTDATIKRTGSGSLVVEAVVRGVAQGMLPVDAVIEAPQNASTPADAILLAHRAGVWAIDASIAGASGGYIAVDAIITRTASATISASAVLSRTNDSAFVLAALLKTVTQASFLADAVIEATRTGGAATDAVFLSPQTSSFSLDAVYIPGVGSGSFPLEAVLGRPYQATFAADAILLSTGSGDFTAGATIGIVPTGAFSADAVIAATRAGSLTLDAITLTQGAGLFGVDASISGLIPQEIEATVSADTIAATVTAGTLDATASAVTYASANTAATIDFTWYFTRRNLFRVGAELAGAFTLDAEVA